MRKFLIFLLGILSNASDLLQHLREDLEDKSTFSSSEHIENKVLTITSESPSSEDHFDTKIQANISPSDKKNCKTRRRIDRVQEKTANGTKQVISRTQFKTR